MTAAHSVGYAERRRFRRFVVASAGCHVLAAAMLGMAPSRPAPLVAPVITVDLLASLPGAVAPAASAAKASPKPAKAPPKVERTPKSLPKPKKIVLPKQAPAADRKPRNPRPPKREKPEELDYSAALAKLRSELGETESPPNLLAKAEPSLLPLAPAEESTGVGVDEERARWYRKLIPHVRRGWVVPPEFQDRELETHLMVDLAADGRLLGEPRIVKSSGDPFWDDKAVLAILRASPLPPPPAPGEWPFSMNSLEQP